MADSFLQDIICCIGHPVSANPTQYVMECATAAAGLDCRCLTLDVAPDQLEQAIGGMRAMGFCGAIVAVPHETQVGRYVDNARGVAAEHNYVDLICRENGSLVGEATIGSAILTLVRQLVGFGSAAATTESATDKPLHRPDKMPKSALVLADDPRAVAIAGELAAAGIRTTIVTTDTEVDDSAADKVVVGEPTAEQATLAPQTDADAEEAVLAEPQPAAATATQTPSQQLAAERQPSADAATEAAGATRYLTWEQLTSDNFGAELVVEAGPSRSESRIVYHVLSC